MQKSVLRVLIALLCLPALTIHAAEEAQSEPDSEECLAFKSDPDADLGDVLRAGCEPTLGQMSALMDNPVGNVAMLFTQYDSYVVRNDANGDEEI